jgi:hypothetical protein
MPNYLVESYLADSPAAVEAARKCARSLSDVEAEVRYTRTIFLPGDETVLHVFEAPSPDALRQAARRAGLHCERVVEAVETSACRRGERSGRGRPGRASR